MSTRRRLWLLWGSIGALLALLLVPSWRPLQVAWRCYHLYENGVREQARVVKKLPEIVTFALLIEDGPHAGQSCTADTSAAVFERVEEGQTLQVVYVDWKPGECELESTIEASAQVLWSFIAMVGFATLLLVALGAFLHRTLSRPATPPRRMPVDAREVRCPACGKPMEEGYVPLLAGLSWRGRGEPVGLPHALQGMRGTVGWRGRPRLHAFRCEPCEVLTLQYGDPPNAPKAG